MITLSFSLPEWKKDPYHETIVGFLKGKPYKIVVSKSLTIMLVHTQPPAICQDYHLSYSTCFFFFFPPGKYILIETLHVHLSVQIQTSLSWNHNSLKGPRRVVDFQLVQVFLVVRIGVMACWSWNYISSSFFGYTKSCHHHIAVENFVLVLVT